MQNHYMSLLFQGGTKSKTIASVEVYANVEKHAGNYSVPTCPIVFVQALKEIRLDT